MILLERNGANINCSNIYDESPLHISIQSNFEEVVNWLLIKGININSTNRVFF